MRLDKSISRLEMKTNGVRMHCQRAMQHHRAIKIINTSHRPSTKFVLQIINKRANSIIAESSESVPITVTDYFRDRLCLVGLMVEQKSAISVRRSAPSNSECLEDAVRFNHFETNRDQSFREQSESIRTNRNAFQKSFKLKTNQTV